MQREGAAFDVVATVVLAALCLVAGAPLWFFAVCEVMVLVAAVCLVSVE